MQLKNLEFVNYRNLANNKLFFHDKINIFIGDNGQGKTNLLEAIYLTTITKSFKTNKMGELIRFESPFFYVQSKIVKNNNPYWIKISYENEKAIFVNDNNINKYREVVGLLNAILFVPEDVNLLKDSPRNRRKIFDIELSKLYPLYLQYLTCFQQVQKQRNLILKSKNIDLVMLNVLDLQLVEYGSKIFEYRKDFLGELEPIIQKYYHQLSSSNVSLKINYLSNIGDSKSYLDNLKKSYDRDQLFQQTHIGIHRDDFTIYLNGQNAALFASQGEQRTIILALKLALVEYIKNIIGEYPILLLDDVMSELDLNRQQNLLSCLNKDLQIFITTTDLEKIDYEFQDEAKFFLVRQGIIEEEVINE